MWWGLSPGNTLKSPLKCMSHAKDAKKGPGESNKKDFANFAYSRAKNP
jgi:hypothetical protein